MNFHQPPAAHVEHVSINVSDLNASALFYTTIVGLRILYQDHQHIDLTANGVSPVLSLYQPENPVRKGRTTGLYHFAILLPDRQSLAAFLMHISRQNVDLGAGDHHVSEALYFNDPDGNGIEVYRDRDAGQWIWHEDAVHMVTDPLNVEGIMESYDPNQPWNGMPEDTVMGHLHLHVSDLNAALPFYTEGLGLKTVASLGKQAAFLSFENYHHHIAINTWNGKNAPSPPDNSVGLKEYILRYPSEETLSDAVKRLQVLGFEVRASEHGFYSQDPSGNKVLMAF